MIDMYAPRQHTTRSAEAMVSRIEAARVDLAADNLAVFLAKRRELRGWVGIAALIVLAAIGAWI